MVYLYFFTNWDVIFFATCKKAYIIQTALSLSIYNNEITNTWGYCKVSK